MILVGDVGGTKTHLALVDEGNAFCIIKDKKYPSKEYPSLLPIIQDFLTEPVSAVCLGVAGPVQNGICRATNLPWIVDIQEIGRALHVKDFLLINDLVAMASGISRLQAQDFFVLNEGKVQAGKNSALVAPGTGLGVAGLFWNGKGYSPIASEGGHIDFAPRNDEGFQLWQYLQKRHGRVSYERVVSGMGIANLYRFFTRGNSALEAKEIVALARSKSDEAAIRALGTFISACGSFTGDMALSFFAEGGIYLGGGILPHILPELQTGAFMKAFCDKGRFSSLLSKIAVKVICSDKVALIGAHVAYRNGK